MGQTGDLKRQKASFAKKRGTRPSTNRVFNVSEGLSGPLPPSQLTGTTFGYMTFLVASSAVYNQAIFDDILRGILPICEKTSSKGKQNIPHKGGTSGKAKDLVFQVSPGLAHG